MSPVVDALVDGIFGPAGMAAGLILLGALLYALPHPMSSVEASHRLRGLTDDEIEEQLNPGAQFRRRHRRHP